MGLYHRAMRDPSTHIALEKEHSSTSSTSRTIAQQLVPFLQLMRLDRPKPALYFVLPHLLGLLQGATLLHSPAHEVLRALAALLLGTFFLRGATCTWNDIADVDFDRQVARTRARPLARGAVSVPAALGSTALQACACLAVLTAMPPACSIYAIPAIVGWWAYPLAKRVTHYPQVVLGFPMAWGVLMGATAVGAEPLQLDSALWSMLASAANPRMETNAVRAVWCLYLANVAWTLCYETVYSYQDVRDDAAAGVKNIALLLGYEAKWFLGILVALIVALLAGAGVFMHASLPFYVLTVLGSAVALSVKITSVDLRKPAECQWWFSNGGYITGMALLSGFVYEYATT